MEEIIRKYEELYDEMASSRDPMRMMAFGDAEKWVFHSLAKSHPEIAERWLTRLEAGKWNNYLSKTEAEEILSRLVNQDGSKGAHWDYDTLKNVVESLGGHMKDEPYYNGCSLWVVVNMLWSDHHESVSEFVPREDEPRFFYAMALEKLKDADRPKFVRAYFDV